MFPVGLTSRVTGVGLDQHIAGLYITVYQVQGVQVLQGQCNLQSAHTSMQACKLAGVHACVGIYKPCCWVVDAR
jgi:hypothetical protein